ncbi:MAG: hypothetical protein ACRD4E_08995 [Bryobacteraceae bacterium]
MLTNLGVGPVIAPGLAAHGIDATDHKYQQPTAQICERLRSSSFDTDLACAGRTCQSFYEAIKTGSHGRQSGALTRSLACEWAREASR